MRIRFLLIFLVVLWGTALFAQSSELVGTASVVSSTGSDPTPTVTLNFNSTVGFLPQDVDTGDIMLVRQVFAGNHRRKLYEVTGISGNSPLVLTLNLIEGTTGGPFPAGTHAIFRRTAEGALLDVPNTSQEIESYINNYNVQHFEDLDVDTIEERNDSMFLKLNDGTEFYAGPSTATAIDTSYQVGDSIYIVSSADTIFTGIAYANPGIDTTFLSAGTWYVVTTEGDTLEVGDEAQVVVSGAAPVNPATYAIHIDTLGVDTVWFDNDSTWVRFSTGGTSVGGPFFKTNNNFSTFIPSGTPPIGSFIWNNDLGCLFRKLFAGIYVTESDPNGRLVRNGDRYFETGGLTSWQMGMHAAVNIYFNPGADANIAAPTDIDAPSYTSIGGLRTIVLNNSTGSGRWAIFDSKYKTVTGLADLDSVYVVENSVLTLDFTWDEHDGEKILRAITPSQSSGTTYTFSDSANGLDLAESGGTVTVAPDITEMTYAAVVGADSIMIWDNSANAHRRTSISEVVALASAGAVTVTDQANGLDITLAGQDISIAPDFGEVASSTAASADSILIYDVSAGGYRRTSAGSIASLATASTPVTGVQDQANGLDIALNGSNVIIDYDFSELPDDAAYNGTEQFIWKDLVDNTMKKGTTSFLSGGYLDLTTNQTVTSGVKKFNGTLQYGLTALPTGSKFGCGDATGFYMLAGTVTESNFQNSQGFLIANGASGPTFQITRLIGVGSDAGAGIGSAIEIWARPSGLTQDWKKTASFATNGILFGNSTNFSTGNAGGVINVPIPGVGFDGAQSLYKLSGVSASQGFGLYENGGLNMEVPPGQQSWVPFSDSIMKHDIVELIPTAADIREFKAYSFVWNASDSATIGVIAQDIELTYPDIVHGLGETGDTLGVDYFGIASLAYGACKSLQLQIDSLTTGRGVDSDAAANDLTLATDKTVFTVTGNTTINALTTTGRQPGAEVTMIFTGTPTVKHNTAGGAGTAVMILAGAADLVVSGNTTLTLVYDGTRWHEKCRSINH